MKIRNGFVTNSSSTNYIILSQAELNPEKLTELLGVSIDSPLYSEVYQLSVELLNDNKQFYHDVSSNIEEQIKNIFSKKTQKQYCKAVKKNEFIYYGHISDDEDIKASFALDCKKIENDDIIIDFTSWAY